MTAPDAGGPPAPPIPWVGNTDMGAYGMRCAECEEQNGSPAFGRPLWTQQPERDDQALDHATRTGHIVTLYTQDERGTTITGKVDSLDVMPAPVDNQPPPPEPPPPAAGRARPAPPTAPLVAFIARAGADPDLMCRIPPRAGAAWLLTAAHACALGRGSLGIQVAHRVMFAGRVARDPAGMWSVRIDGLLGATDARFGAPVGAVWSVDGHADITHVEDTVERLLSWEYMIPRNEFTVVLMSDAPVADPPDPQAEQLLREERLAARRAYRSDGAIPPLEGQPG